MAIKKTKVAETPVAAPAPKPAPAATPTGVANMDWSSVGVTGLEKVTKDDLGIPFLVILQKGSPQVDRTNPEYPTKKIDGAEPGDIINTLANEVVYGVGQDPLSFVPCFYEKLFIEWKPQEQGGGFIRAHGPEILAECKRNEKGQDVLRNGNMIATTAYFYGTYIDQDSGERRPAVIGMTSTQLKKARQWLNTMTGLKVETPKGKITPPMFSHIYNLETVPESNEKGSWMGWKISLNRMVTDPVLITESIESAKRATSSSRQLLPPPSEESSESKAIPFA